MYIRFIVDTPVVGAAATDDHVQAIGLAGAEVGILYIHAKVRRPVQMP